MKFQFGYDKSQIQFQKKNIPIIWDSERVINSHFLIVGGSGMGKTYTIRKILRELAKQSKDLKIHVIDVHGDIDIGDDVTSTVIFSETSDYGLSPLNISPDLDFGGVRKKIRSFISMINRTSRKLGSNQEDVLTSLLTDLYEANNFLQDNPQTWSVNYDSRFNPKFKKRNPTIKDLKTFTEYKLKQMMLGAGSKAMHHLENLNKTVKSMGKKQKEFTKNNFNEDKQDKITEQLTKLKDTAKEEYAKYIDAIETGQEWSDLLKYDSADTIKSVFTRISNLEATGIFKSTPPDFDTSKPVRRYVIKSLNDDEQTMFTDILLEQLFMLAKEAGEQKDLKHLIVVDEAHKFTSEESTHIMNIIAKEARKFGFGMMWASQSFGHFPEDIIANTSTKVILGIDEMYQEVSAKKLLIDKKRFTYIQPHKSCIVQIKNKGALKNTFVDVSYEGI